MRVRRKRLSGGIGTRGNSSNSRRKIMDSLVRRMKKMRRMRSMMTFISVYSVRKTKIKLRMERRRTRLTTYCNTVISSNRI